MLAFGLRGHLFRSRGPGAARGQRIETGTEATLTSALELGPGRFVVAGLAGTLLWSDGAGGALRKQELPDRKGDRRARAGATSGHLLLFGEGGVQHLEIAR